MCSGFFKRTKPNGVVRVEVDGTSGQLDALEQLVLEHGFTVVQKEKESVFVLKMR